MQKWEYKVIQAWQGRVRTVDNQEQLKPVPPSEPNSWALSQQAENDLRNPLDFKYLNELGEEGWELVAYDLNYGPGGIAATVMIFKRQKG
jgi:hypothetical protein